MYLLASSQILAALIDGIHVHYVWNGNEGRDGLQCFCSCKRELATTVVSLLSMHTYSCTGTHSSPRPLCPSSVAPTTRPRTHPLQICGEYIVQCTHAADICDISLTTHNNTLIVSNNCRVVQTSLKNGVLSSASLFKLSSLFPPPFFLCTSFSLSLSPTTSFPQLPVF